jgi:hypothetical protein
VSKEHKPLKIQFAPGCFDNFDGTQEELDALMAELSSLTLEDLQDRSYGYPQDIDYDEEIVIDTVSKSNHSSKRTLH